MKTLNRTIAKGLLGLFLATVAISASAAGNEAAADSSKTKGSFTAGCDVVSSYVWRGFAQNPGANIQPGATFTYGGLSIGAWGSTNFIGSAKEVDFFVSYTKGAITAMITDYNWLFSQSYFNYDRKTTDHVYEATINYAGVEKFPLSLSLNTMFLGADLKSDGKQAFSTYCELAYPVSENAKFFFGGLIISESAANAYAFVNKGFSVTNIGFKASKELKMSDTYSLPVYGVVGINPATEDAYLVAGITF